MEATRIDQWLWSVRLFKTRSLATDACRAGHVTINGTAAKAATRVSVGDRVEVRIEQRQRTLEVTRVINKRVGAPIAAECLIDHSPPPPDNVDEPYFRRDPGAGRPTKRDRRLLDRMRSHLR